MLWTKGWLETRMVLLYSVILFAVNIAAELFRLANPSANPAPALSDFLLIWVIFPLLLAGNGIRTPSKLRASADGHQSVYYTLSLPVSRFRLFAVRAATGLLETIAVVITATTVVWISLPVFRPGATIQDAVLYVFTLLAYTCAFYSLSLLLAAMFEGPWRPWGTFLLILGARWVFGHLMPQPFDILDPIGANTPLSTHVLPWSAIAWCTGVSAICFVAASKLIEVQEY